jgi:pilus assembly protein CpaF
VVEGRTADGTRVHAVHQSHAVGGPLVTVTRLAPSSATCDDLAEDEVISSGMSEFLETCVRTRRNIVVCASPGASLGALVSALGEKVPSHERVVTVEHVSELNLQKPHVVTLEAKAPSGMRDMVANALRMAPDRLVVHEMVGAEALEAIIAMGGGQEGTVVSTHASSANDALARLTTMVCMGREEIPARVARQQIADSVDVVVCLTRFADGSEKVTEIVEVTGAEVDMFTTQDIFAYKRSSSGGQFVAKGAPSFYQDLKKRGESVNMAIFRDAM